MATAASAKRMVLFGGSLITGLSALEWSANKGGIVPIRIVVGGLVASSVLLAVADMAPDLAFGLTVTALLAAVLVPGPNGQSRVDLFRRIGGSI